MSNELDTITFLNTHLTISNEMYCAESKSIHTGLLVVGTSDTMLYQLCFQLDYPLVSTTDPEGDKPRGNAAHAQNQNLVSLLNIMV